MKYFCSKCGRTTEYNLNLPKFCSQCGYEFASVKTSNTKSEFKLNKINEDIQTVEDDDFNEENLAPAINFKKIRPNFKVDLYHSKGETLDDILDNKNGSSNHNVKINTDNNQFQNNDSINKKSPESILAEFQREAGALRQK